MGEATRRRQSRTSIACSWCLGWDISFDGAGPNRFGNNRRPAGPDTALDPERDVFAALERWVEQGVAPEQLIGSGTVLGDETTPMTHPICTYPKVARYKGTGDINDATRYACVAPAAER